MYQDWMKGSPILIGYSWHDIPELRRAAEYHRRNNNIEAANQCEEAIKNYRQTRFF